MAAAPACIVSLLLMGCAGAADLPSTHEEELVGLINSHRQGGGGCAGHDAAAAPALSPDRRLAGIQAGAVSDPMGAARAAGYIPAKVQVIDLSGPRNPRQAMQLLTTQYCQVLIDAQFTDVGVARDGSRWQVALARPLLDEGLGEWREAGEALLDQINQARAQPRSCGSAHYDAALPLRWNDRLAQAAMTHGSDMADANYFSHVSRSGDTLSDRVDQTGYPWRRVGENLAAGAGSPERVVAGWLDSPTHCSTLMNPHFTESGAGYAIGEESDAVIYWVQVYGSQE